MQDVLKHHHHLDPSVNDGRHYLPQYLNQPYPPGFHITFGKQDQDVQTQIRQDYAELPHMFYQLH